MKTWLGLSIIASWFVALAIVFTMARHYTKSKGTIDGTNTVIEQSATYWIHSGDSVEEYDRCVNRSDGKILIEVVHAVGFPSIEWAVFENGYGRGEYVTQDNAINAAIKRRPECAKNNQIFIK